MNYIAKETEGTLELFFYNMIPTPLKIQLVHIWNEFFTQERMPLNIADSYYQEMAQIIRKEHSLVDLPGSSYDYSLFSRIHLYFGSFDDVEKLLDIIELVSFFIENAEDHLYQNGYNSIHLSPNGVAAINETNQRFKMNGVGYQYQNGKIIRLDNQLLHIESVERTLDLLKDPMYENVNQEFLTAHEHFRFKRNADCLTWCLKAYESTIKIVANQNGWPFEKGSTARPLTQLLFKKQFFPPYLESAMSGLQTFLEQSINTIRNQKGGHGNGIEINHVPDSLAQYMLYITGSTINLIIEIQKERF